MSMPESSGRQEWASQRIGVAGGMMVPVQGRSRPDGRLSNGQLQLGSPHAFD
jgi:hypothetical protein